MSEDEDDARRLIEGGAEFGGRVCGRGEGAFTFAAERVAERLQAGDVPRRDDFIAEVDGRSPNDEILEGVLLAAGDAYEERRSRSWGDCTRTSLSTKALRRLRRTT